MVKNNISRIREGASNSAIKTVKKEPKLIKSISLSKELVDQLNKSRGLIPFSPFVEFLIVSELNGKSREKKHEV